MIDDTIFQILPGMDPQKLVTYEEKVFKNFMTNLKTIESKLVKDEYEVPSVEERKKNLPSKGLDKLRAVTHSIGATSALLGGIMPSPS